MHCVGTCSPQFFPTRKTLTFFVALYICLWVRFIAVITLLQYIHLFMWYEVHSIAVPYVHVTFSFSGIQGGTLSARCTLSVGSRLVPALTSSSWDRSLHRIITNVWLCFLECRNMCHVQCLHACELLSVPAHSIQFFTVLHLRGFGWFHCLLFDPNFTDCCSKTNIGHYL